PPAVVAPPEVTIDLAQAAPNTNNNTITLTPPKPPAPVAVAPPPPPPPPTPPEATTNHAVTAADYPPISIRLTEQGTVGIKYVVGADGNVNDCNVTTSSGHPRLDDAACVMVKKRWKFKPATQDGKPVGYTITGTTVVFKLQ